MFSEFSYPIICAKDFAQTVNFYEDHLNFIPAFEMEDFAVLKREDKKDTYLAIIGSNHKGLPKQHRTVSKGLILNYPVNDVHERYRELYYEGLTIISEPSNAYCGRKHFLIEDPNGILIDICENIPLRNLGQDEDLQDEKVA